ncbi:Uncharacterised protein [Segatella copri]|nr:Uncharacterised protein [Segatella copri]
MIYIPQLQFNIRHRLTKLHIHSHDEKGSLFFVYHTLTLIDKRSNIFTFLIKAYQLLFLIGKGWFVFICIVYVTL